jgi:hypothetical protein
VCAGREHLGTWKAFLKKLIIYIHISASECVLEGEKKIEQNLFFKEKEPFDKERKNQFKQGKFFNSKVLKFWVLLDKVPSHF